MNDTTETKDQNNDSDTNANVGVHGVVRFLKCLIGLHDWTYAANEGVKATQEQLDAGIDGFWDYAKMYCRGCGRVYNRKV